MLQGVNRFYKRLLAQFAFLSLEMAIVLVAFVCCLFVFLFLTRHIIIKNRANFDQAVFDFIAGFQSDGLTSLMKFVTFFASLEFLIGFSGLLTLLFLFIRKHLWYSLKIPVITAGSSLLNQLMKRIFDRPRPATAMFYETGLSFPSGHAMIGGSLYGIIIYLVWTSVRSRGWRLFWCSLIFLWSVFIGFSRVYLRVHYASDVLAGFSIAIMWLVLSLLILNWFERYYNQKVARMVDKGNGGSAAPAQQLPGSSKK